MRDVERSVVFYRDVAGMEVWSRDEFTGEWGWRRVVVEKPFGRDLASARALLAAGDKAGATTRFETLLVDYPTSALAPQARRELERMKGQVPPATH